MHNRKRAPSSKRNFIAKNAPELARVEPDTTAPLMGQRKRPKKRRPTLFPTPLKAD